MLAFERSGSPLSREARSIQRLLSDPHGLGLGPDMTNASIMRQARR
jgi:hypothetical protein